MRKTKTIRSSWTLLAAAALATGAHGGAWGSQEVFVTIGVNGRPTYTLGALGEGSKPVSTANWEGGGALLRGAVSQRFFDLSPVRPARAARSLALKADRLVYRTKASAYARRAGLDEHLVHALIEVESGFNPDARSIAGAKGLMQLMPATARRFGATDAYDPDENLRAGTAYLRFLFDTFPHDARLAIAAYNAGEGAVIKHRYRIPPYAETQKYVPAVIAAWRRNHAAATAN